MLPALEEELPLLVLFNSSIFQALNVRHICTVQGMDQDALWKDVEMSILMEKIKLNPSIKHKSVVSREGNTAKSPMNNVMAQ